MKKIWFHLKWFFKKRYLITVGVDFGSYNGIDKINAVIMRYDRKKETFKVIG